MRLRWLAPILLLSICVPEPVSAAIVVDVVRDGSSAAESGIQAGDILLGWRHQQPENPKAGDFISPWDLLILEIESASDGSIMIAGRRKGKDLELRMATPDCGSNPCGFGIRSLPLLSARAMKNYVAGRKHIEAGEIMKGIALWRTVAQGVQNPGSAAWLNLRSAFILLDAGEHSEADQEIKTALTRLPPADLAAAGLLRMSWAQKLAETENTEDAVANLRAAIEDFRSFDAGSRLLTHAMMLLAWQVYRQGGLEEAGRIAGEACGLVRSREAGTLSEAWCGSLEGELAMQVGHYEKAETGYQRALQIYQQLLPEGLFFASALNNLGILAVEKGELTDAEELYKRAIRIYESRGSDPSFISNTLLNLGNVSIDRGDYVTAEEYYRKSLDIELSRNPKSRETADAWYNLAIVAYHRKDFDRAEDYFRKSLDLYQRIEPDTLDVASCLGGLAQVFYERLDYNKAIEFHTQALAIQQKVEPDSLDVAFTLSGLGITYCDLHEFDRALQTHQKALAIRQAVSPDSLVAGESLNNIAYTYLTQKDYAQAEQYYQQVLQIRKRLAPGSIWEAESLHDLGLIRRSLGKISEAEEFFSSAVEALEAQRGRVGGAEEVRSGFAAAFHDYYRDLLETLLLLGRKREAFTVLERSRAQSLLAMLAERDLVWKEVPPELERERRASDLEYDRTQEALQQLNPRKEPDAVKVLVASLREIREKQAGIAEKIRKSSPQLDSLKYPHSLDVQGVQHELDPGTVLLSYSVGEESSNLFVITPEFFEVYEIQKGSDALRKAVENLRKLVQTMEPTALEVEQARQLGHELFDLLISPAAPMLDRSARALIVPDAALHLLPFGCLIRSGDPDEYFVEWRPFHLALSATLYAQLRKERPSRKMMSPLLVAFGDPVYPQKEGANTMAAAKNRGFKLTSLPSTRNEVDGIATLFPNHRVFLGADATEENMWANSNQAQYLHFACHGILDKQFPLNSSLVLSIPPSGRSTKENGWVQAWEIFERLRLQGELVTLSACETALGKEMGGEGLVGLTRAFHQAGARSVVASLWRIADQTTAVFMKEFYAQLARGRDKDEALRLAQVRLIRSPVQINDDTGALVEFDASLPFYWAAFELSGDWK